MTRYVVYTVDEDYWMPLYVSLYSLLCNNRDLSFEVFVLYDERDDAFFNNVDRLEASHGDVSVEGIRVGTETVRDAPTPHWFTEANLYRFLIGTTLPLEGEDVLYLDCDTVVDGSLEGLFETDLEGSVAAATPEYKLRSFEMGLPIDALFYNAGVMYIDLGLWTDHEVGSRAMDRITARDDADFPVQEVLNPILNDRDLWTPLHPKYNAMTNWAEVLERETGDNPVVVHYTGTGKPWLYTTERLHTDLWWEYLDGTPYRDYRPPDRTVSNWLAKGGRTIASRSKTSVSAALERYSPLHETVSDAYKLLFG